MKNLWLFSVFCIATASASAAKVKVWHHHRATHYEDAEMKQVVISNEGALRLSRQLEPLVKSRELKATHVWDMKEDAIGNLYVATGKEGKIYRISPSGKVTVAYQSEDSQVLSLALSSDGSLYAGTGPSGTVVRIDPQGRAKVIAKDVSSYVWSLAVSRDGKKIYAGTGPKGCIYELTSEGRAKIYYKSKQDHVLCVAVGPKGQVYAGTDKQGLVYRITNGKAFVLYQVPQSEVRALTVTPKGIYVGTSAPTDRESQTTGSSVKGAIPPLEKEGSRPVEVSAPGKKGSQEENEPRATSSKSDSSSSKEKEGSAKAAPAPSAPDVGENSLYHISTDGTVREVFREEALVLSLLPGSSQVLVGTGLKGRLYEVLEKTKERSEIARLDHGQILCMAGRKNGSIVVGTGDPGRIYVLKPYYARKGTVLSEVLDAKIISKWGSLRWQGSTPDGTSIAIAVRTGNVEEPDETWSEWSPEQTDPEQARALAPPARFLQYRVTLSTTVAEKTPVLRGLTVRYRTTNQAPEVTKIEVPNLNAQDLENPKKVKLKWSATDANEDKVRYHLYARKNEWQSWVLLAEDVEKTYYYWDTTTMPSGHYRVKVVASDKADNPASDALTGSRVSAPFVVSHSPPEVKVKVVGIENGRVELEAVGKSPLVRITSASFAVNGKKWIPIFPNDKLFDSKTETFRFQAPQLKPGTYVVVLKTTDAAGTTGSGDVVFTIKAR